MGVLKVSAPSAVPVSPLPRPVTTRPATETVDRSIDLTPDRVAQFEQTISAQLPAPLGLQLDVDEATHTVIGRVVNKETGELVHQFPSKEMISLMARTAQIDALFLNKKI